MSAQRFQTVHAFLNSYSECSADALLAYLSPEFSHQVLPTSIGMPKRDRDGFAGHAAMITSVFSSFAIEPQDVFEDPTQNAVIVYAHMKGEIKGLGPHNNECMMILRLSQDQTKIEGMTEFVDSMVAMEMKQKMVKMMGEKNGTDAMMKP
ncbi:hypothetical protein M501DRAFT_1005151 [Patellaria atrata CBS 101060]|uniref:SnoaL-like domain-containing protein n=1 Tax=Patellaria atrata CBS 101060 TaxID=1346257 RepID=A0A9P4S9D8_9PEZI|nr:hypothetical protein M501DRAFT_1005151 [Patellaria atrata CBS 101060]